MATRRIDPPLDEVTVVDLDSAAEWYARERAATGDAAVRVARRNELIHLALPMATRLARRYRGRGEPLDDLEQVARLALVRVVDRYDPRRGSFTAYAIHTITGELKRHFRDRTWGVRVPRALQELGHEVRRSSTELTTRLARTPTVTELADELGVSRAQVDAAVEGATGYAPTSLNAAIRDDGCAELGDRVGSLDPGLDAVDDRETLGALLGRLPTRERQIIALRFYGNQTQAEIGERYGISQVHVSRVLSRALTWLRTAMLSETAPPWPGGDDDAAGSNLTIATACVDGAQVVTVSGEVDYDNAGSVCDALLRAVRSGARRVRVDLDGVPLIDGAGVAAVLAAREAAGCQVAVVIDPVRPHVRRTLVLAGLTDLAG
ncbi:MAG TPA: SigB/SigF/SigG family RNA polymerase sigma factor [Micromonosporaceae bacterium]